MLILVNTPCLYSLSVSHWVLGWSYEKPILQAQEWDWRKAELKKPHIFSSQVLHGTRGTAVFSTLSSCWLVKQRLGSKELKSSCPRAFRAPSSRTRNGYSSRITVISSHLKNPSLWFISVLHWSSENVTKSLTQCCQLPFFEEIIQKCCVRL